MACRRPSALTVAAMLLVACCCLPIRAHGTSRFARGLKNHSPGVLHADGQQPPPPLASQDPPPAAAAAAAPVADRAPDVGAASADHIMVVTSLSSIRTDPQSGSGCVSIPGLGRIGWLGGCRRSRQLLVATHHDDEQGRSSSRIRSSTDLMANRDPSTTAAVATAGNTATATAGTAAATTTAASSSDADGGTGVGAPLITAHDMKMEQVGGRSSHSDVVGVTTTGSGSGEVPYAGRVAKDGGRQYTRWHGRGKDAGAA